MNRWSLLRPWLHALPAECAHDATLAGLAAGLGRMAGAPAKHARDPRLAQTIWGRGFANPLGLAAGFDKDARVVAPMLGFGFGFVEIGTVTPRPQPGNPRPRLFRLAEDRAVINRLGFNNAGMDAAAARLERLRERGLSGAGTGGRVGVNIGRNKDSPDAVADYRDAAARLGPLADYLVVNVSSPNTPGLRDLQGDDALRDILAAVRAALAPLESPPPVLVKIAPDLTDAQLADICALARDGVMDGLTVSNTTVARPDGLRSRHRNEVGGLSGAPLLEPATEMLRQAWRETRGRVPLIGVGGVGGPHDAYAKIRAGASLVQLYSALVYEGPGLIGDILDGLVRALEADGFASLSEAVGADHR